MNCEIEQFLHDFNNYNCNYVPINYSLELKSSPTDARLRVLLLVKYETDATTNALCVEEKKLN